MNPDTGDPFEELARELRRGVGAEWKDEAEITELETRLGELRKRRLSDIAREAMHRGDLVSVTVGTRTLTGSPMFVGKDYLVLQTPAITVDVVLDRALMSIRQKPEGGHTTRGGSATFRARLAEYEHTGEPVTFHLMGGADDLTGRIIVAAADHCTMTTAEDQRVHVPVPLIDMISRPR